MFESGISCQLNCIVQIKIDISSILRRLPPEVLGLSPEKRGNFKDISLAPPESAVTISAAQGAKLYIQFAAIGHVLYSCCS